MLNGPSISFHYIDASCTVTSSCQAAMSRRGCHYCRLDLGAATNCQKCKSRICNARKKQVLADCFASQARQFIFRKEIEVPMMSRSNTVVQFSVGDHPTTYSWVMPSVKLSPESSRRSEIVTNHVQNSCRIAPRSFSTPATAFW